LELLWLCCCQLESKLEIEFLPVHIPNEAEKEDALLFAENVRAEMSECLKIPMGDFSIEDVPYLTTRGRPKLSQLSRLFQKLNLEE